LRQHFPKGIRVAGVVALERIGDVHSLLAKLYFGCFCSPLTGSNLNDEASRSSPAACLRPMRLNGCAEWHGRRAAVYTRDSQHYKRLVASPALADLRWAAVFAGSDQGPCGAPAMEASLPGGRGRLAARARIGAANRRVRHRPDECYESKVSGIRTMVGFTGVPAMSDDLLSKTCTP